MAEVEFKVKVPKELEEEVRELPVDWSKVILEAIKLKVFELELERSRNLRRVFVEAIASKSGLSEEEANKFAVELGRKIK